MTSELLHMLQAARAAEKEQALFYRALSTLAEDAAAQDDVEALNGLLADEQHHLSRITVRLVEAGHEPGELPVRAPACALAGWRAVARAREEAEIALYEQLVQQPFDDVTLEVLRAILATEREHARHLGGKYTSAEVTEVARKRTQR